MCSVTSVDYVITTEYDINLCRLVMIKIEDERITTFTKRLREVRLYVYVYISQRGAQFYKIREIV